jgi:hypothetical protein
MPPERCNEAAFLISRPETGTEGSDVNSSTNNPARVKLLAAVIGGSAVVAMGALGVAFNAEKGNSVVSDPSTPVTTMTTGQTITEASVAPTSPETPMATPPVTATTTP